MTALSIKELKEFFKLCRKNKVANIKFNGVEVVFLDQTNPPPVRLNKSQVKKLEETAKQNLERDNVNFSEEQIENMHIEDPAAYEEALIEGELESDRAENH